MATWSQGGGWPWRTLRLMDGNPESRAAQNLLKNFNGGPWKMKKWALLSAIYALLGSVYVPVSAQTYPWHENFDAGLG